MTNLRAALVVFAALAAVACTTTTTTKATPDDPAPVPEKETKSETTDAGAGEVCGGFPFAENGCGQCGQAQCCAKASACMGDADCSALLACVVKCSGTSSCIDGCVSKYDGGLALLDAYLTCTESKCAGKCGETKRGIGDKCTADAQCKSATCTNPGGNGWCSQGCRTNSDCLGTHGTGNEFGGLNYCVPTDDGNMCFPSCTTNADCAKYDSAMTCKVAGTVKVCSF